MKHCLYCGKFIKSRPKGRKYCIEACAIRLREKTREEYLIHRKAKCEVCGNEGVNTNANNHLLVHHIDCNQKNNSLDNLITLCRPCHSIAHKRNRTKLELII